jgi:hypothetical protein
VLTAPSIVPQPASLNGGRPNPPAPAAPSHDDDEDALWRYLDAIAANPNGGEQEWCWTPARPCRCEHSWEFEPRHCCCCGNDIAVTP